MSKPRNPKDFMTTPRSLFKSVLILATFLVTLTSPFRAQAMMDGGGWSGGGGDPLRFYFEDGQKLAATILSRYSPEPAAASATQTPAALWLASHYQAMQTDIMATQQNWVEVAETTCAYTQYSRSSSVRLSFKSCRSISSREEAARLLIHESVHHFGIHDESLADQVATAAIAAWQDLKLRQIPLCAGNSNIITDRLPGKWKPDAPLNLRLGSGSKMASVEFIPDNSVLPGLPGIGRCAQMGGYIIFTQLQDGTSIKAPFVLPEWKGNAEYLVFDPAHPTQPPVRFFVNIAKAQATADDVLLMGEDEGAISIAFSRQ